VQRRFFGDFFFSRAGNTYRLSHQVYEENRSKSVKKRDGLTDFFWNFLEISNEELFKTSNFRIAVVSFRFSYRTRHTILFFRGSLKDSPFPWQFSSLHQPFPAATASLCAIKPATLALHFGRFVKGGNNP